MLVSYNGLKLFVDVNDIAPNELAKRLTFAGVEVESVNTLAIASNLVIGQVIECDLIPETHLHLCKVNLGEKLGIKQIICGAPNVRTGLKVIVSLPGAKLAKGEIKKSVIRGYESDGMLCSLLELGIDPKYVSGPDLTGIHEFSNDEEIGNTEVLKRLGFDDTILNLKLLANRPDLLSLYNVAREAGTLFNKEVKPIKYKKYNATKMDFVVKSLTTKCPQFSVRIIKGIKVKESPDEVKQILIAHGIRPINNIVDIGNLVMLITGQPLHMYDYDKLPKKELIIKSDYEGKFLALDEKEYDLVNGDIVITSDNQVMCLGGVMGGDISKNDDNTVNIVIESANFDFASIRRTSTRLNLVSESSNRFAHGINPNQYNEVIEFTTDLVNKYAGLKEVSPIITYDNLNHEPKLIQFTTHEINNILGTTYDETKILDVLNSDGFKIVEKKKENITVKVPDYRIDVYGVNDLAEEVIRILGFNDINPTLPTLKSVIGNESKELMLSKEIKNHFRSIGLYEVFTYVLVNKKRSEEFKILNHGTSYKLVNPMTDDHEYVRTSVIPSLLDVVSYNLSHQNKDFGLFEISDVNYDNKKELYLGVALTGDLHLQDELKHMPFSFYYLKGLVTSVFTKHGIERSRYQIEECEIEQKELHPTRSAYIKINKEIVAYLGELHPLNYQNYNIKNNVVYILEMNLSKLINVPTGSVKFKPIPRFPSVSRDLALLADKDVKVDRILTIIRKSHPLVKDVHVFDVYENLEDETKKSIAVKITLLDENNTLKDEIINQAIDKIITNLLKENITIR